MKKLLIALALALNSLSCAMGVNVPQEDGSKPVEIIFHADTRFTTLERSAIQEAANQWLDATNGLAQIHIYWDKTTDGICQLSPCMYRNVDEDPEVIAADEEACLFVDKCVLGWVDFRSNKVAGKHPHLHLIPSRDGKDLFKVTIHELGHTLGLAHIPDRWAIMYPVNNGDQLGCITQSDISEYCRVNSCGAHKMNPCEKK